MTALEVFSAKRNRVYVRKFDHDAARVRHAAGEKIADLASEYGVTTSAVYLIVTPGARERQVAAARRYHTAVCERCGGRACALVGGKLKNNPDGRLLCVHCRGIVRRENVSLAADGTVLRLWCSTCRSWKPPAAFGRGTLYRDLRDGGFHKTCRSCLTVLKRDWRDRNKVPCSHGCGTLVDGKNLRQPGKAPECGPCSLKRIHAERAAA